MTDLQLIQLSVNRMAEGADQASVVNGMFDDAATFDAEARIPGVQATPELTAEHLAKLRALLQKRKANDKKKN